MKIPLKAMQRMIEIEGALIRRPEAGAWISARRSSVNFPISVDFLVEDELADANRLRQADVVILPVHSQY